MTHRIASSGRAACRRRDRAGQAPSRYRLSLAYLMKAMASKAITMKTVQKSQPGMSGSKVVIILELVLFWLVPSGHSSPPLSADLSDR